MPKLVNSVFGDPALFVPVSFQKRGFLFDLGDISYLSPKDILKISHVFVTHTHMDHFFGFDMLLRIMLGRDKKLYLFGPEGFIKNIEGKLKGYSWNLVENYSNEFIIYVREIKKDTIISRYYKCNQKFLPHKEPDIPLKNGIIHTEPSFKISTEILDHQIPCLGFRMEEKFSVNIIKEKLEELELDTGPWLTEFKKALYNETPEDAIFEFSDISGKKHKFILRELAEKIAVISRGDIIAYITDTVYYPENIDKIIKLAKNADHLFIEAPFLDEEKEAALKKYHLTARQAGEIAKKACVKKITPFHFSSRHANEADKLINEAYFYFNSNEYTK
jgi:ribonuclease Z